jgi:hypothetical protein
MAAASAAEDNNTAAAQLQKSPWRRRFRHCVRAREPAALAQSWRILPLDHRARSTAIAGLRFDSNRARRSARVASAPFGLLIVTKH